MKSNDSWLLAMDVLAYFWNNIYSNAYGQIHKKTWKKSRLIEAEGKRKIPYEGSNFFFSCWTISFPLVQSNPRKMTVGEENCNNDLHGMFHKKRCKRKKMLE